MVSIIIEYLESNKPFTLTPEDFEKDDDSNYHIDFMTCCANLRARMYNIGEKDRLTIKGIAGRIIPAIATTTTAVAGLATLEMVKYVSGRRNVPHFRNFFMNLALPLFLLTEPREAPKISLNEKAEFTLWDRWDIKEGRDITPQGILDYFKKKHNLQAVSIVTKTGGLIYDPDFGASARLGKKIVDILRIDTKETKYIDLDITFQDEKSPNALDGPPIRLFFRKALEKKPKGKNEK